MDGLFTTLSSLVHRVVASRRRLLLIDVILVLAAVRWTRTWRRNRLLPPGPRGLPFFGHYLRWPKSGHKLFSDWPFQLATKYNFGLVYVKTLSDEEIFINDYDTAVDILEKRSASYSSRPSHIIANDIGSLGRHMLVMPYNEKWRKMRVAIHPEMTPTKVQQSYVPLEEAETRVALHKIAQDPASASRYMRQIVGNVTLRIVYGMDSETEHDKEFDDMTSILYKFFGLMNDQIVDILPPTRYLPGFLLPCYKAGMDLQRMTTECFNSLFNAMLQKTNNSTLSAENAMAARWWQNRDALGLDVTDVSMLAGTMFEGATDTTTGLIMTYIVVSVSYPHIFKAAQAELDKICGDHPPTVDDLSRSEYLRAMCKETLRWYGMFAVGLPHKYSADQDDFYNGYRIPAGATIIPNNRAMTFNPKTYGQKYDVYTYEPRRWIDRPGGVGDGPLDDGLPTFGFGRRVCPGKHMAMTSFCIFAFNTMYYFDVGPKEGAELKKPIDALGFWEGRPDTSKFYITPRPGRLVELERDMEAAKDYLRSL